MRNEPRDMAPVGVAVDKLDTIFLLLSEWLGRREDKSWPAALSPLVGLMNGRLVAPVLLLPNVVYGLVDSNRPG